MSSSGFIYRLRFTLRALSVEGERSLAYILGHHVGLISALRERRPFDGVLFRVCVFFLFLVRNVGFKRIAFPRARFFFYADTHNQQVALMSTISALPEGSVLTAYNPKLKREGLSEREVQVRFGLTDIVIALLVFFIRAPRLYFQLKDTHPATISNFFNFFCMAYVHIPYYARLLSEAGCEYVIQSNDHNVTNRSLRLVAELLGVKNVYMQHASVSTLFPALQFEYSFLDGLASFNVYKDCVVAQGGDRGRVKESGVVYLSGQKKELRVLPADRDKKYIAIAVNALDKADRVIELLNAIESLGVDVSLRMHPAQSSSFIQEVEAYAIDKNFLFVHKSTDKSLVDFFGDAYFLIAANSSIHLEASVSGLLSYYYEFSVVEMPDYYGYIGAGLIKPFPVESLFDSKASIHTLSEARPEIKALQFYSATYGTGWQGREGELVAECLMRLSCGAEVGHLFTRCVVSDFDEVYRPV